MRPSLEERFWSKVKRAGVDECWEWQASRRRRGYGQIGARGRTSAAAHRVAWELTHGPIPDGLWVLHRCDNPPCVNPAHLFLGTAQDNVADMNAKGRANHVRGERARGARLTEDQVRCARALRRAGAGVRALERAFEVSHGAMMQLLNGSTWTHVQGP